ncbi:MAG: hypothetical protein GBAus27B_000564 [Mycoplasmataceae bacterium]|nr:MAG: hypothetical protein GBAus27B_000564 [Mycoplasmataceae bacterium]
MPQYWIEKNFDHQAFDSWIKKGLKASEYELAYYLRHKNVQSNPDFNLKEVKNDGISVQEWIDFFYPLSQDFVIELDIDNKSLKGNLDLSKFINLKTLKCSNNKISCINFDKCSKLEDIHCYNNQLVKLDITNCHYLTEINCSNNLLRNFIFSDEVLSNLKSLDLSDNDLLTSQDLSFLAKAVNLENLWLRNDGEIGSCYKCQQPNTDFLGCRPCSEKEWKEDIEKLSGQELIEKFIKKQNSELVWIPYDNFSNIEYLSKGGFAEVYKAKWRNKFVALKVFVNSPSSVLDFLNESSNFNLIDGYLIVKNFGISQDPKSNDYLIVMDYMKCGDLRNYLQNNYKNLNLRDKMIRLSQIAKGICDIHRMDLVHCDLHSGNILNDDSLSLISDLGLSKPSNYHKNNDYVFGVLPYLAPF